MIQLDSVTYSYPGLDESLDRKAVKNVSLGVAPGELVLCTGRSGCGKSTLIRLINGLAPQYHGGTLTGTVLVNAMNNAARSLTEISADVGTLFQNPETQFFALTVADEAAVGLECRGYGEEQCTVKVQDALSRLGLTDIAARSVLHLSEGQKQKTALAGLLALSPKALILDEPSANLDPESAADLARILVCLKELGLAVFVADHRLAWLNGHADRVIVMDHGEVQAEGPYSILEDAALRERCGLRDIVIADPRERMVEVSVADHHGAGAESVEGKTRSCDSHHDSTCFAKQGTGDDASDENMASNKSDSGKKGQRVKKLTFAFGKGNPLFQEAEFFFPSGHVTALLGPNGCGKTTLARLCTGLLKSKQAEFFHNDQAVPAKHLTSRTGLVLQNADHQLRMRSVSEELSDALAGLPPEQSGTRIDKALDEYALVHLAQRHPQSLSGGEKQRLSVAAAMVRQPGMVFLDEPTSGLDGENMRRMGRDLRRAADNGAAVVVITHDLEFMNAVCDRKITLPLHAGQGKAKR